MGRTLPSTGTWWGLLKLNIERIWEWWNNDDNHDQRISWPAEARDAELCTIKGKSKVEPIAISWQSQLWWWSSLSMSNRWLLHLRFCDTSRNIVEETRQRSKSWMVMIIVIINMYFLELEKHCPPPNYWGIGPQHRLHCKTTKNGDH